MGWIYKVTNKVPWTNSINTPQIQNNIEAFRDYFNGYMTQAAMAGLLGNAMHESYLNPGQKQLGSTTSSAGWGLIQWTPATTLTNWCSKYLYTWYDGDTQCYRIRCEGERTKGAGGTWLPTSLYPYSWEEFCALTDYGEATKAYLYERERAGVTALTTRLGYAADIYNYLSGIEPGPTPPGPEPPEPAKGNNFILTAGKRARARRVTNA